MIINKLLLAHALALAESVVAKKEARTPGRQPNDWRGKGKQRKGKRK